MSISHGRLVLVLRNGNTHVCIPNHCLFQLEMALQAAPAKPILTFTMSAAIALAATLFLLLCPQRLHMHLQCTCNSVRQRAYLLHTKAYGAAPTNAAQLIRDFFGTVSLRKWAEHTQVQRNQAAQRLGKGCNIATGFTNVNEHLQWSVLVAIDRDVDFPFRRTYLAGVALYHCWSCFDPLLDRYHWLHLWFLLGGCFLLVFHPSQN